MRIAYFRHLCKFQTDAFGGGGRGDGGGKLNAWKLCEMGVRVADGGKEADGGLRMDV